MLINNTGKKGICCESSDTDNNSSVSGHGGDVYRNEVRIDFSVNLNPLGVPDEIIEAAKKGLSEVTRYPDPYHTELRQSIAGFEHTDPDSIVCGSGASELIMASVHAFRPEKALITAPCYSGYETALKASDADIHYYRLDENKGFRLDEGNVERITEDRALSIDELKNELEYYEEDQIYLTGDGADICFKSFGDSLPSLVLTPMNIRYQHAYGTAMAAMRMADENKLCTSDELMPIYLRIPQAERELQAKKRNNDGNANC